MKIYARMAIAAGAFLTVCAGEAANAATTIDTDFSTTDDGGVAPNKVDVASATSIGFDLRPISNIVTDNTGIMLNETLPVRLLAMLQGQVSPRINAVGTMVFAVSIALVVVAQLLIGRRLRLRAAGGER